MPCDVPASVFANAPEMSVVPVGSRYFLTLLPNHRPQPNAPTHTPSGWGWVDDRLEGPLLRRFARTVPPLLATAFGDVLMGS